MKKDDPKAMSMLQQIVANVDDKKPAVKAKSTAKEAMQRKIMAKALRDGV